MLQMASERLNITPQRLVVNDGVVSDIENAENKEYYPLSSAQKRLYILQQMDLESTVYNIPSVQILTGKLNRKSFEEVFRGLVQRHESLRTSFEMVEEESVQRIYETVDFEI